MKILKYSKLKKTPLKFRIYFKCMVSYFRQDPLITQLHLLQTNCQITKKIIDVSDLNFLNKSQLLQFFRKVELIKMILVILASNALSYPSSSPFFHINVWLFSISQSKRPVCQICTKAFA